jgi:hypothetical protein
VGRKAWRYVPSWHYLKSPSTTQYMGYSETIKEINRGNFPAFIESMTANMVSEDPGLVAIGEISQDILLVQ